MAARLGGDEFAILFPELGGAEAMVALERVRSSMATMSPRGDLQVSVSIGGATFSRPPEDVDEMIRLGDAQMYAAKTGGRNRVVLVAVEA